jgi:hypothetical protein
VSNARMVASGRLAEISYPNAPQEETPGAVAEWLERV